MTNDVLMTITPEAFAAYQRGVKSVELRRRRLHMPAGSRIWFYVKLPVRAVALIARLESIGEVARSRVWSLYGERLGFARRDVDLYLDGCQWATVLELRGVRDIAGATLNELRQIEPDFNPPQIARRLLPDGVLHRLLVERL